MPTYFKPLRRKIGVITLVLACVYSAFWIRAINMYAAIGLPQNDDLDPYYRITITLTLLSAWLLLSKPRAKPTPTPLR